MPDFLEQLKQHDVPPLPERFERQVHERVNENLIVWHLAELMLHALPYACLLFAQALWGMVRYSLSGKYGDPPRPAGEQEHF